MIPYLLINCGHKLLSHSGYECLFDYIWNNNKSLIIQGLQEVFRIVKVVHAFLIFIDYSSNSIAENYQIIA